MEYVRGLKARQRHIQAKVGKPRNRQLESENFGVLKFSIKGSGRFHFELHFVSNYNIKVLAKNIFQA